MRVLCHDNGVGLPSEAETIQGGLGMMIAQVVSAELRAELDVRSTSEGLSIALAFDTDVEGT